MSARDQLNSYIGRIERRLRIGAALRGAAILASAALVLTVILVLIANAFAFVSWSIISARFILFCALVYAASFGLAIPLLRLNRRRAAAKAEAAFPDFKQRLVTFAERDASSDPFIELLAADTMNLARSSEPKRLITNGALLASCGFGLAALAFLAWLIAAAPGYIGYGAALLWRGSGANLVPYYNIKVTPGDASVRRNSDELVTAQTIGFEPSQVHLFARYDTASKWNELPMLPQPGGSGFQFTFAGIPEGVEYYVEAGAVESRHFKIRVVDLPAVKAIRVTYKYPSWTGMKPAVDPHGGDLRAIEGTTADLEIRTDRPLQNGVLILDNGQQIQLSGGQGNLYRGAITLQKDGAYHIAALDQGRPVRLSEDFFIEANKANPPDVAIVRPARDYRASPIEEVTIGVHADDAFGLDNLTLHYSVNGGAEQTVDLLGQKGVKQADGSTTVALENLKLVPGDIISYYATAKDARADAHTDIQFVQVDPFEREFSQSQQAGGGGGGGGNQNDISDREKEIIAETWKQAGEKNPSQQADDETGKFLSEVQSKLRDQAIALAGRLGLRDLNQQNQTFGNFQSDMSAAAQAMNPAAASLRKLKWKDALPSEQKALQHLLQAEATFRQIQVAFGNTGGAGGGGAGRDLASLFDLELDTQKNQYETEQTAGSSASQRQQAIDDALRKLDALAQRQQDLVNQQRTNGQTFEQRWQEEMLRRNAQQLQQQLQQLAQSQQQNGSSSGQSSGQSGSQSSQSSPSAQGPSQGQSSQGQSQNSTDPRIQSAINSLREATDALSRAASQQQSAADARRAADRLRDATQALGAMQSQQDSGRISQMANQADQLAMQQQKQSDELRRILQQSGTGQSQSEESEQGLWQQAQQLARDRQNLADGVGQLEQQMRSAARQMASNQHAAASKLRDALGNLDQSDLETRLQRSADWLRRGYAPDPNAEPDIATDLRQLADSLRAAQQALGPEQAPGQNPEAAIDNVERLREQMQSLTRALGARDGNQNGGQNGNRSGNQINNNSGESGEGPQSAQLGRSGQFGPGQADRQGGRVGGRNGIIDDGYRQGYAPGAWRGGNNNNWYIDTGNNSNAPGPAVHPDTTINTSDPERDFEQTVNTLNQLNQNVQSDPEVARQVKQLEAEMQRLDPRRFPGNPALLEQLHNQVLSDVDNLELQLRRKSDDQQSQIRSSAPMTVPAGYQDAVADYFRRLSDTSQHGSN